MFVHEYACIAPGDQLRWFSVIITGLTAPGQRRGNPSAPGIADGIGGSDDAKAQPLVDRAVHATPSAGAVVMHIDVTDRKSAEEELSRSERRYKRVVETAHEGIWLTDSASRATLVNNRMASMLGYTPDELIGQNLFDHAVGDGVRDVRNLEHPSRAGKPESFEARLRHRDGHDVWVIVSSSGTFDERGEFQGSLKMITDITDRRKTELALKEADEQLRQAQKMEAVGQLASGIAHDFNNLLTAIRGYTSLARSTLAEGHPARESLDQVEEASGQAAGVAGALLTFARKKRSEMSPVRIATVVETACRLFRRTLGPRIKFEVDVGGGAGLWINGDETQLHQVITNLALNARDSLQNSGTISIRIEAVPAAAGSQPPAPGSVRVIVGDTGAGMPPHIVERIFEPFFTTKPRGSGTGLGLSVIHGIVLEHGGTITVQSQVGRGSTFTVTLPCIAPPGRAADLKAPGSTAARAAGPVLIVQNSPMVRGVVASMLGSMGYEPIHASTCAEAEFIASSNPRPIAFAVADLNLVDGTAITLLEQLRAYAPRIRCIVVADVAGEDTPDQRGIIWLRKPFRVGDLEAAVDRLSAP